MIPYRKTALAAVLGATLLASAMPALADDDTSNAALLKLIQQQAEQIKLLEKRLAAVEQEKAGNAAPPAAVAAQAQPAPTQQATTAAQVQNAVADTQQSQLDTLQAQVAQMSTGGGNSGGGGIDWSNGVPTFRSPDGTFTWRPTTRLIYDFSSTHGSAYDARNINGTEGRELRLGSTGHYGPFGYRMEVDFQDSAVSIKDAWLSYSTKTFGLPTSYYLGNHLKDRAIESSTELDQTPFMERGAVASVLGSVNAYYGLGPFVKLYGDNWHLGASVTGSQLSRTDVGDDSIAYNVRAHWNPLVWNTGMIHLGSWYYFQKIGKDTTSVNSPATIATDFNSNLQVSPGAIANPHRDQAYGYEFAAVYRGLWTYDEYGRRRIETLDLPTAPLQTIDHKATTLAAGWLLTGEKPGWDRKNGTWGATTVLDPITRGWGGWEVAFRYDKFDYGDAAKGSVAHSYTYGVNWYLTDWSRLMFEYIDWTTDNRVGNFPGPDSGNTIGLRAQLVF